jgi:hypothetical protein
MPEHMFKKTVSEVAARKGYAESLNAAGELFQ